MDNINLYCKDLFRSSQKTRCVSITNTTQVILFGKIKYVSLKTGDRDSSVGIATLYGLDGPRIESRGGGGRDFPHPSRPAVGPTQPPIQWVPGLSRGVKRPGRGVDHQTPI